MARINIPAPISTYRDLGAVELAKLARNQYIEGFSAADEFENSVSNMRSLEKDDHLKTKLSNQYSGMLDKWSSRGDYETLGIAINKGANQFVRDYSLIDQSVKNRGDYQERLRDAYDKKLINANTYQGRMAQSDAMYQGIQSNEEGVFDPNSVYGGKEFYNDVDITEKINKRLKELKPFIRQNLGTEIPYNEDMEITNTRGDRGEVKYWVTTKSKTVQLPDNIIQSVVNDVMADPDVSASLAQGIELKTYQLSDEDASGYISKLIESGDIKEEEIGPMVEQMGPLVALQNIMYHDEVARETNLALGSFGGVRESSSGRMVSVDELYKINHKAKLTNAAATYDENDLSYGATFNIKPSAVTHGEIIKKQKQTLNLLKENLSQVTGQLNVNPDNIELDSEGREIFGSGGEGLNYEDMTTTQIMNSAENQVDAFNTATTQSTTEMLDYMSWKRSKFATAEVLTRGDKETSNQHEARIWENFIAYQGRTAEIIGIGQKYINDVAGANNLDVNQFNNIMHLLSGNTQDLDVIDAKINSPVDGLRVPNRYNTGDLTVGEYNDLRGNQLLDSKLGTITGQDMVDAYNSLAKQNPETMSIISHPHEIPAHVYNGQLWNNMATNYKDVNTDGHALINELARIKADQGDAVSFTYVEPLGGWQWDNSAYENGSDFRKSIEGWFGELSSDNAYSKGKYAEQFDVKDIAFTGMIMTNLGADYTSEGNAVDQLHTFFKGNVFPSHWAMYDAQGQSDTEFDWGYINAKQGEDDDVKNHFKYTVEYDILEDQMGIVNAKLGDKGAMIYVPIKIKNGASKGKVHNMLVPAHYFNLPSLNAYVNSPEMEVNSQWNAGVLNGLTRPWSPKQYSNVTFDYQANTVTISGEEHSKEVGLAKLVQNIINERGRSHQK